MTRHIAPKDWGGEETHRLWDWIGSRKEMHRAYFTYSSGRGIVGFLDRAGLLRGKALDYGCGPGFLTERLIVAGVETFAADYSKKSVDQIERRLAGTPGWGGACLIDRQMVPFASDSFDLVTCVETIEHVPEGGLVPLIDELRRVLKPGGRLLLTTPNEEVLEENLNYCPFCDTEFHRWQHLHSWGVREIEDLVCAGGLSPLLAQGTDFSNFQNTVNLPPWSALSIGALRDQLNFFVMQVMDRYFPRPFPNGREFAFRLGGGGPHLCVVATKVEGTVV